MLTHYDILEKKKNLVVINCIILENIDIFVKDGDNRFKSIKCLNILENLFLVLGKYNLFTNMTIHSKKFLHEYRINNIFF